MTQLHDFQRWEIKHGQMQDEVNSTILDPKNMILDTKIIFVAVLVKKNWPKLHFWEMAENIMYP